MGFSFVEQEGSRGVLGEGGVTFYNALRLCQINRLTDNTKVFGNDKDNYRLPGNGKDIVFLAKDTPVIISYKSTPDAQEQIIGTIIWENDPNPTL